MKPILLSSDNTSAGSRFSKRMCFLSLAQTAPRCIAERHMSCPYFVRTRVNSPEHRPRAGEAAFRFTLVQNDARGAIRFRPQVSA